MESDYSETSDFIVRFYSFMSLEFNSQGVAYHPGINRNIHRRFTKRDELTGGTSARGFEKVLKKEQNFYKSIL